MDALLTVARQTGCDALHPGYGFLSENAEFAQRCADLELTFIGPSGDVIRTMGNKAAARALMQSHGVPVVPGSDGPVSTAQDAQAVAEAIGYPVLVKASAGGGGRGMRRVDRPEELVAKFEEARRKPWPASVMDSSIWRSSSSTPGTSSFRSWPTATGL